MFKVFFSALVLITSAFCAGLQAAELNKPQPEIYLQPNTTQIFTELYQAYGLLNPPKRTFFEDALYLDQSIPPEKVPLQPSNQVIFEHASEVLAEFHKRMGDLELYVDPKAAKPFFYTAVGSKQLIVALVYAIALSEPDKKFLFVEQAPFYSGHPNAVTGIFQYPNAKFLAFHDPSEIKLEPGVTLVEFVTSPNNPDGKFRGPLTDAPIIIADFVFASSAFGSDDTGYLQQNLEWIREKRAQGKHVFSFNSASKQFGKTGTRVGYTWYPLYDSYAHKIFNKFFGFISSSTVAGGSSGLAEFLDLVKALLALPDQGHMLREDARKSLQARHELVEHEFMRRYPGSSVISIPGSPTFFAKVSDARLAEKSAADVLRDDLSVVMNAGEAMGESNEFIRLNLSGYSEVLVEFLNRLHGAHKYTVNDILLTSMKACGQKSVTSQAGEKTVYTVHPADCKIEVDARQGPVEIRLARLIDYLGTFNVVIKRLDSSNYPVVVLGEDIQVRLKKKGDEAGFVWSQALYLKGRWKAFSK